MAITKQYLDLNGLKYLLSKLSYTKPADAGKFLTGLTETKGVISGTWADLAASDIPAIGTPTKHEITTAVVGNNATIHSTITRDAGTALTANILLGVSGDLTLARNAETGALTIGYTTPAESIKGVKADGYLTLGADDKLLDINSTKLANADTADGAAGTLLTTKAYVDKQVTAAIAGGVQYKGTTATVPASPANGDMYKVTKDIAATTGGFPGAKAGDVIIYHTTGTAGWDVIPSGDDVEYTGIKVGDTTVIGATKGGDATFAAGDGLSVAGEAGKVTYSHAAPVNDPDTELALKRIAYDKFGHIYRSDDTTKADIANILGNYVSTIDSATGDITLKAASETKGDINLTMTGHELSAAIVGLGTAAFEAKEAFAAAKHTHAATDVTYDKGTTGLTATNVQGAITELAGKVKDVEASAGVTSFGGQTGAITVNTTDAANGSINFTVGTDKILKGTVAGWATKQDAFEDGSAAIVTTVADSDVQTEAAENSTSTTIKSVTQTNGKIGVSTEAVVEFKTISNSEIDALFA